MCPDGHHDDAGMVCAGCIEDPPSSRRLAGPREPDPQPTARRQKRVLDLGVRRLPLAASGRDNGLWAAVLWSALGGIGSLSRRLGRPSFV